MGALRVARHRDEEDAERVRGQGHPGTPRQGSYPASPSIQGLRSSRRQAT
jgi:hypothetical protein